MERGKWNVVRISQTAQPHDGWLDRLQKWSVAAYCTYNISLRKPQSWPTRVVVSIAAVDQGTSHTLVLTTRTGRLQRWHSAFQIFVGLEGRRIAVAIVVFWRPTTSLHQSRHCAFIMTMPDSHFSYPPALA